MNFNLPKNLSFNILTVVLGVYIIVLGVAYYAIFHKHHKRNKVELDELVNLVTKYYTRTMLATFFIFIGVRCFGEAIAVKYDRTEVILYIIMGILIISATILNYIFYIKNELRDYDQTVREENKKRTIKIGEILELIFFTIFILMPIWQIPVFIEIEEKKELIIEVAKATGIAIASGILLVALNPIDIKGRISKKIAKTKNKQNKKIYK